jgi:protein-S-isoprenylcysteine O-methyltransferase Ste14
MATRHDETIATARDTIRTRPPSATRGWIVFTGVAAWAGTLWSLRSHKMLDGVLAAVISMAVLAAVNYALDVLVLKVHRRESTGLQWTTANYSLHRTAIKYAGMVASVGFIGALYWLFPEYSRDFFGDHQAHPVFYGEYREMLHRFLPWWFALSLPYIYFVDGHQKDPRDGYFAAGAAVTLQFEKVNFAILWQHCLSWLVKGYFLALMFTFCVRDTRTFINYDFSIVQNFRSFFDCAYFLIFLADVMMACVGYFLALRIFDTHVRRTEPTFKGWMVALVCYQPFWSWFSGAYFAYANDYTWGVWLENYPGVYQIWGSAILAFYGIYLWATIMFGVRFSNLTHRGILTNGPYRWTKHPAYIFKNLAYWLTCVPFVVSASPWDSLRRCVLLGLLNYVYYLRAKTEEANLGTDPVYVQYSEWIKRHGIFRWLPRFASNRSDEPMPPK